MKTTQSMLAGFIIAASLATSGSQKLTGQESQRSEGQNPVRLQPGEQPPNGGPGGLGPGGWRGPGGSGGMMMGQVRPLVKQFDKDGDGRLNLAERTAAREFLKSQPNNGPGGRRFGGPGGGGPGGRPGGPAGMENQEPAKPGKAMKPSEVQNFPDKDLYDSTTLRTLFIEFEGTDWEKELMAFNNTDVEVPARLVVDGKTYEGVGVHIRGMSSSNVPEGRKHSLNLSMDFQKDGQNLGGYRTLNLLNSHEDPSLLRSVLYSEVARSYIPAPKANFVRVVINGENWGVFVNAQQFNKDFLRDFFKTTKGARWKAPGSPGGRATLAYLGEDVEAYRKIYSIKSKDDAKSWASLIRLCKILNTTPAEKLEEALAPILDVDGALKFLAVEMALINNDGYWIRSSDYCLYLDEKGRFHVVPHDMNEAFARPGGPGFGGGGGRGGPGRGGRGPQGPQDAGGPPRDVLVGPDAGREPGGERPFGGGGPGGPGGRVAVEGVKLDPLHAAKDENKPLISKLLAVPSLRSKYLGYLRDIAQNWLDWEKLGPVAKRYQELIREDVKIDTRKLDTFEAFEQALTQDRQGGGFGPGGGGTIALKNFADQRRAYLLEVTQAK